MNPADAQLIEQIQQATQGGSRLLVTLARRGKALERNESERAAFLLAAVATHPLYKGGRLAFDMLEIEDLILADARVDSMSTREVIRVLNVGAQHLVETLRQMGSPGQGAGMPAGASTRGTDVPGGPVIARAQSADQPAPATLLPRMSLGPADAAASAAGDVGQDASSEPDLRSSDYLYDFVVLGLLDAVAGITTFQS